MARLWNVGSGNGDEKGVPTVKRRDPATGKIAEFVRVPPESSGCICGPSGTTGRVTWDGVCRCGREQFVEHHPGNVYLALTGFGFFTVPKGQPFDIPPGVSVKAVRDMCPHLISQEDADFIAQQSTVAEAKPEKQQPRK